MMWSDVIPQDVQALGAELAKRAACERDKIEREFRRLLDEKLGRK